MSEQKVKAPTIEPIEPTSSVTVAKKPLKEDGGKPEIGGALKGNALTGEGKLLKDMPLEGGCDPVCAYAFVSLAPGSRAYIGRLTTETGVETDGFVTFLPTGEVRANAMMPGVLFHSHGVYVTDSKVIRDKLLEPIKAGRKVMYMQYDPDLHGEVTAYLKDPKGECVIEGACS